ncbi:threonine/serine dehydratase [Micromonospora humida]|uniref:Threonine/serine dehydratase n=1 Tax=Micromonospora humida TaxID=2809018 RepID=A0ABS2IXX0_9ACTN|nr:threonine/serine dehydratase [Micromonospora humida]MBM7079172.1 threonine/serine dehydratase [Micromonospora humida]
MLTKSQIEDAANRIAGHVRTTPTVELPSGTFGLPYPVAAKLELLQVTGSFKPRGAFYRMISSAPRSVIAASGGNHGLAVAYAARELGIDAEVFLPVTSSPIKVARLNEYGARVTLVGERYDDALTACRRRAAETGATEIHAYDQAEVVAGQGTVGRELDQQLAGVDTVLVAVGGGGLVGGIAAWFDGSIRVVAVEPGNAPSLHDALRAGHPVDVGVSGVAADSLGARRIGDIGFDVCVRTAVQSVLVEDDDIAAARRAFWDEMRLAVEYGGSTALAALRTGAYRPEPGERVAVVVCGANTDPGDLVARP